MSLGRELSQIFGRELDRMAGEVAAYPSDAELWTTTGAQKNPPGALALHTVGGLLAFIGVGLGGIDYVRDREREFAGRDVPRDEVVRAIRQCRDQIVAIVGSLDDAAMPQRFPGTTPPALEGISTQAFLMHLLWHLGWHTGHIYYHRLGITAPPVEATAGPAAS